MSLLDGSHEHRDGCCAFPALGFAYGVKSGHVYRRVQWRPARTSHSIGASDAFKRQARRMDQSAATVEMYRIAFERVIARGGPSQDDVNTLRKWSDDLATCGLECRIFACGPCRKATVVAHCCHRAICPREQRRRAQKWCARGAGLAELLPNESRGEDFTRVVGLTKRALGKETFDVNDHTWKALEIGLIQRGTDAERLDAHTALRTKLMLRLRRRYGMMAALAALDRGPTGNIHVHAVVYCGYLPRADLQRWLRSQDCTIPGCTHEPDDRCAACKRLKRGDCSHPRADGRPRCNGSWYVDVRKCRVRHGSATHGDPVTAGIVEAIKYACAPVGSKPGKPGEYDAPTPGEAPTESQLAYAEGLVLYFLALRNRKRVETYGLARLPDPHEENGVDDREPDDEGGAPLCPDCRKPMKHVATGDRLGVRGCGKYEFFREQAGARGS